MTVQLYCTHTAAEFCLLCVSPDYSLVNEIDAAGVFAEAG